MFSTAVVSVVVASATPHLQATLVDGGPKLDGMLDDAVWLAAKPWSSFTQKFPDEGKPPSEPTTVRVIYDDEALYIGIDCVQRTVPLVRRLTRRGREVESDRIEVDIGTRRDGKSAFQFEISSAGVLVDGLRFNDTDYEGNWDENWDARAAITPTGWSAEIKIPFRVLRFDTLLDQSWDLEVRRYTSARQETDEWAFIPRNAGGEVSHYGKLDGLIGLHRRAQFELRPFVLGRMGYREPSSDLAGSGLGLSGSAGLDIKWHPSQALTFDAALNPDFGQVEPDQLVLNLTKFETYYPEKRPFFLEGSDVFATPMQLVYTRRIGRVPPLPALRDGEQLVDLPSPTGIYGAAKLTGRVGDRWMVGALEALTQPNIINVQQPAGAHSTRLLDPMSSYSALRIRRDIGTNADVALTATAVAHFEPTGQYPLVPPGTTSATIAPPTGATIVPTPLSGAPTLVPQQLCSNGLLVASRARCFNDAFVVAADWRWRSSDGSWVTGGQAALSVLNNGPPRLVPDGTIIRPGDPGTGIQAFLNKEGGKHWVGDLYLEFNDRKLDINDMGYDRRANNVRWRVDLEYRELQRFWSLLEAHARFEYFDRVNIDGLDLGSGYQLNISGRTTTFWNFFTELHYRAAYFDDREIGDGTALQRAGLLGWELELTSNRTKRLSFTSFSQTQLIFWGFNLDIEAGLLARILPQIDFELLPTIRYTLGEPRYVGTGPSAGQYLFGKLDARAVGVTLRATYTFTPRLSLDAYAQLFLASEHFSDISSFESDPTGRRPVIRLSDLHPYTMPLSFNPDIEDAALNVNLVLRWEFLLGSTLYLVYTHAQSPNLTLMPGEIGNLSFGAISRAPSADVLLIKLAYWIG
jgi:hypothetical protein